VQALAGQTKISIEVDADERAVVIGDPALLEQAVLALLDNAINYNRAGGRVMVRTAVKDEQALLEVENTGIGIASEHLSHLGERFYRVDKARSREAGGTMSMLPFASSSDGQGINEPLLREYAFFLANKAEGTIEAYLRTTRQVMIWAASRPGNGGVFQPQHLTKTVVEMYLASLERAGFSLHHRARVKSALSTFARWLIEEKGLL
jgi:hypothetical protein